MRDFLEHYYKYIAPVLLIGCIILAYSVGKESGKREGRTPVTLACDSTVLEALKIHPETYAGNTLMDSNGSNEARAVQSVGKYVGSKNGTKYYTPGCQATSRIKPENLIWFSSADDAQLQGYSPGSC